MWSLILFYTADVNSGHYDMKMINMWHFGNFICLDSWSCWVVYGSLLVLPFFSLSHTHTHMYSHTAPQKWDCCWGQADIKTSISTVQEGQPESIVGRKMRSRKNSGRTRASGGGGSQESKTPQGVVVVTIQTTKLDSWLQLKTQVQKKGCLIKRFFSERWKVLCIVSHIDYNLEFHSAFFSPLPFYCLLEYKKNP